MFKEVELGNEIPKAEYKKQAKALRLELLRQQFRQKSSDFPVILLLAGSDRLGRNRIVHLLSEWLDLRFLDVNAIGRPSDDERERPEFYRYWRRLPAKGRMGVFLAGWTTFGILAHVRGEMDDDALARWTNHVREFEDTLVADGAVLVKIWTHISKEELGKRLKKAEACPDELWNIGEADREIYENYDRGIATAERVVQGTSTGRAPWHVVESTDRRHANLTVARILHEAIGKRLDRPPVAEPDELTRSPNIELESPRTVLDTVDLSKRLEYDDYKKKLEKEQARIHALVSEAAKRKIGSVLVFEGWDAAGKGGAIRRLATAVPPPRIQIVPVSAPSDEERAQHYLWRFWRRLPRRGDMVVFDRSWYGRVLVERVERFATTEEWQRAYAEIVSFEEQLFESNYIVHKFWLHIDRDEQLRRFEAREESPLKEWKITDDDWRNRERWPDYEAAIHEMVQRTTRPEAPWSIIAANDKRYARVQVLKTYRKRLEQALDEAR